MGQALVGLVTLSLLLPGAALGGGFLPEVALPAAPVALGTLTPADVLDLLREPSVLPPAAWASLDGLLPEPFVPSPAAALLQPLGGPAQPGASALWTGDVVVDQDLVVSGGLTIDHATVRFVGAPRTVDVVGGALVVRDSTFLAAGVPGKVVATLRAGGAVDVADSTFDGVAFAPRAGTAVSPSIVERATFRNGNLGITTDRAQLVVRHSTFANLTSGVAVAGAKQDAALGPKVEDSTFEMDRTGISVTGGSAGTYTANLARGNGIAVSCASDGTALADGTVIKPRFVNNNLYGNLADAIAGLRGVNITTPAGNLAIASSRCIHEHPYLGPGGDQSDSVFLSTDDSLANVTTTLNPSAAPALPLPFTEITTTETWTGTVDIAGPVVVNSPGALTIDDATLRGVGLLGAKLHGVLELRDSTADSLIGVVQRNDADLVSNSDLGGDAAPMPLHMYRCNCTVQDSRIRAPAGIAIVAQGGLLTDDAAWVPTVSDNTLTAALGIILFDAKPTVHANTFAPPSPGAGIGLFQALGTANMDNNVLRGLAAGIFGILGTTSSSNDIYESSVVGYLGALDTASFTSAIFAANELAMMPLLNPSTAVTLSNFTLNALGVVPVIGVATITSSNLWDNYLLSLAAFSFDTGSLNLPTGITCTSCWSPGDEAYFGNVTYTSALVANGAPTPAWASSVQVASGASTTLDLAGTLAAPAIAKDGGMLRVRDATLDLAGFPLGAKGGGIAAGATGKLLLENATLHHGGFVAANSTDARLLHTHLRAFPGTVLYAQGNGPTLDCVDVRDSGSAARFIAQTGGDFAATRLAVQNAAGVVTALFPTARTLANATVEDSAIRGSKGVGLLSRGGPGEVRLANSNLLGAGEAGAKDAAKDVAGMANVSVPDFRSNWWDDAAGPNQTGAKLLAQGNRTPAVEPWLAAPAVAEPCASFTFEPARRVVGEGPVDFADASFDPSLGTIASRSWDWDDGTPATTGLGASAAHEFATWGTYDVTLTVTSSGGATSSVTRAVRILVGPTADFALPASVLETSSASFHDASVDPDGSVVAREWDFGDGSAPQGGADVTHRFPDGGDYVVTLHVTDDDGLEASVARTYHVDDAPPAAGFSFALQGQRKVQFTDSSSHPNAADAPPAGWQYLWDFGDGSTSDVRSPQHQYGEAALFDVTLTVTDDDGLTASLTRPVDLRNQAPTADFTVAPASPIAGQAAQFTDESTDPDGSVVAWAWDFGDGATSTAQDPTHTYAHGDYTVTLVVTDDLGATATKQRTLHVCETGLHPGPQGWQLELCLAFPP